MFLNPNLSAGRAPLLLLCCLLNQTTFVPLPPPRSAPGKFGVSAAVGQILPPKPQVGGPAVKSKRVSS